jgi:hypothetical protein
MSEIESVLVTTRNPNGPGDLGQVAEGFYTVTNGILRMTDRDGKPLRDENTGRQYAMKLLPGDDPKFEARRLTLSIHRTERSGEVAGFNRPLRYPKFAY